MALVIDTALAPIQAAITGPNAEVVAAVRRATGVGPGVTAEILPITDACPTAVGNNRKYLAGAS
jgi:hypothetical protein